MSYGLMLSNSKYLGFRLAWDLHAGSPTLHILVSEAECRRGYEIVCQMIGMTVCLVQSR